MESAIGMLSLPMWCEGDESIALDQDGGGRHGVADVFKWRKIQSLGRTLALDTHLLTFCDTPRTSPCFNETKITPHLRQGTSRPSPKCHGTTAVSGLDSLSKSFVPVF